MEELSHSVKKLGKTVVTGGTGFIGSSLVGALIESGCKVRVFDNDSRGSVSRLKRWEGRFEFMRGDIRSYEDTIKACTGMDTIFHLAYINGTENFYKIPDQVLDVGLKGAIHSMDAAIKCGLKNYIVTSSSEVYQTPTHVPTTENERMIIPDPKNPRFTYGAGKMMNELLCLHYAPKSLKTVIVRPHNFYGPEMGFEHVIPQFSMRMCETSEKTGSKSFEFPIQGDGTETRSFCYIDDAVDGILRAACFGESREIYHVGTLEEVSIAELARQTARCAGFNVTIVPGPSAKGGTARRCPSIEKISKIGFSPKVSLKDGLAKTVAWYQEHYHTGHTGKKPSEVRL